MQEILVSLVLMYNLLEHNQNYYIISGRLWKYDRDKVNDAVNEDAANYRLNDKTRRPKSFEFKKKNNLDNSSKYQYIRHRSCCSIKMF